MNALAHFIVRHGYPLLFAAVFARQIGLPIPAPLFLVTAGALVAAGTLGLIPALALTVIACVLADLAWYEAGRQWGDRVVHFIHRLAWRDPDAHDRRAKRIFARYGPPLLVLAKFIPGLDAVTPPLCGTSGTGRLRFLAFETVGAGLWSGAYTGLGYIFSHDLERAAAYVGRVGRLLAILALAGFCIYAFGKAARKHWRCGTGVPGFAAVTTTETLDLWFLKRVCRRVARIIKKLTLLLCVTPRRGRLRCGTEHDDAECKEPPHQIFSWFRTALTRQL
jgi:membrane protein DedA with SNARE-associated domain